MMLPDLMCADLISEKGVYYLCGIRGTHFAVRHYVEKDVWEAATEAERLEHWKIGRLEHIEMFGY